MNLLGNLSNSSHSITTPGFCRPVLRLCVLNRQYQPHPEVCQICRFPGPTQLHCKDDLGVGSTSWVLTMRPGGDGKPSIRFSLELIPSFAGKFTSEHLISRDAANKTLADAVHVGTVSSMFLPQTLTVLSLSPQALRTSHHFDE